MNSTPMHSQRHERKALKKQEKLLLQRTEFEELFSLQNLHKAFLKAKKKKRLKPEVYDFSQNIVENLLNIQKEIFESIYKFGPYRTFVKFDSKKRYVVASPFKDRIVHWVIYDYLYEIFDKSFIYDSFGNRKGKGTLKGMQRAWKFMRNKNSNIILKIDLSKYF